ncbi:MAG: NUDIX domain-containing protein [Anaerolineales bacterium]|nr:NUDIX domain-containing protein [Anaerolineales bacterium]
MQKKQFALSVKVVILNDAGQCLLIRRPSDCQTNPGQWEFPGGKAELNERFEPALLRETLEETGLNISLTRVAGAAEYELSALKIAYIIMEGQPDSGEVILSEEHTDFAWVNSGEILSFDLAEQFVPFVKSYFKLG